MIDQVSNNIEKTVIYLQLIKRKSIHLKILVCGLILSTLCLLSCNTSNNTTTTKTVTVDKGVAHYSLSYPTRYNKYGPNISSLGSCRLSLSADRTTIKIPNPDPNKTGYVNTSYVPAAITIDIYKPVENRNALDQLEYILEDESEEKSFQLVDRSTIEISGITAQQAVYYTSGLLPFKGTPSRLIRAIYFDHNGYVWEMSYFSEASMEETVEEDFEYVLSTFKILE